MFGNPALSHPACTTFGATLSASGATIAGLEYHHDLYRAGVSMGIVGIIIIVGSILHREIKFTSRPATVAFRDGYDLGYDNGWSEGHKDGRRIALPVVVPLHSVADRDVV